MSDLNPSIATLDRTWRWFRWRSVLLVVVFVCGLLAFMVGVSVSERPQLVERGLLAKAYYTVGLFVLGGLDFGVPIGGPRWARSLLWVTYFAAPAITASAVVEGVLRAIRPRRWALRWMRRHVVIAGCGKLAMQTLVQLRMTDRHRQVVVVETRADRAELNEARDVYGATIVLGDISSDVLLRSLNLHRASRVLLLTGDDFHNLDAAAKVLSLAPHLEGRVVAHVADLHFLRVMSDTPLAQACSIFNSHQAAAEKLVRSKLLVHFDRTEPLDTVVIAGFGRFGQTVLAELQRHAAGKFDRVVLVDLDCKRSARVFEEQVGFEHGYSCDYIDGDLRDPAVWHQLEERYDMAHAEPAFVIGSGQDGTNIEAALMLAKRYPKAHIVARTFRPSSFAAEVSKTGGFEVFSVAELQNDAIPQGWLE